MADPERGAKKSDNYPAWNLSVALEFSQVVGMTEKEARIFSNLIKIGGGLKVEEFDEEEDYARAEINKRSVLKGVVITY